MKKKLPFSVDREGSGTLISQIVDGVRQSIESGFFKPGDILPGFREIAQETGVCLIVVRAAFKRLAAEGLVCRRRGIGTIVLAPEKRAWRGHIVIASIEIRENHLLSAMTGSLRQALIKAGFLVSSVSFGSGFGTYDFSNLESVLRGSVTLVVAMNVSAKVEAFLSKFDVPYIVFGKAANAAGGIDFDCSSAIAGFVKYCKKTAAKRVLEITVGSNLAVASSALNRAGIKCEKWPIVKKGNIEDISRMTLEAFYSRLRDEGKTWLPDILYFNDNFASQCALLALVEAGVSIPEDVRFVTWSNAGEGPFWRKAITRIEIDPFEAGNVFARYVLTYLAGKALPSKAAIRPVFIAAET